MDYQDLKNDLQNAIDQVKAGTDQTLINFLLRQQNIELNYLPICYNLQDLHSKQLLFVHPPLIQSWPIALIHLMVSMCLRHVTKGICGWKVMIRSLMIA